ncbi:MAG: PadR family transcriptional regulator, partial [Chloroflexi bacterium]|nr:PadR family transcriptional regulator [Chloroflexota bacterium]
MADKTHSLHDPLTLTILATLNIQPSHPYEIQRLIREHHNEFAIVPARSLYHAVNRLQQAGLVEPVETNREGKRPERTIYQITKAGREEFQKRLREMLSKPAKEYPEFMV